MKQRSLARRVAAWLERRSSRSFPLPHLTRDPVRALQLPERIAVIGIGGATLGGSGRTPLAIALVEALAARGLRVALLGHAYGAIPGHARVVSVDDDVRTVGDEALVAASALDFGRVIVGPSRRAALDFAVGRFDVVVVDGLLQTRPRPLARALLAVDADHPEGSGRLFPFGDLLAPLHTLRAIADETIAIGGDDARSMVRVALDEEAELGPRVGLVTSVARPDRVIDALGKQGIRPVLHVERADHAPRRLRETSSLRASARRHRLDAWLLDAKSAVHLRGADLGAKVAGLEHQVLLSPALIERTMAATSGARMRAP